MLFLVASIVISGYSSGLAINVNVEKKQHFTNEQ